MKMTIIILNYAWLLFAAHVFGYGEWEEEWLELEKRGRPKGCAMFYDPSLEYVKENGPSYLELDIFDFTGDLEISFWVLPDRYVHNGPMFNVGTKNFKYYEWKTKAKNAQFLVVEITSSALALLLKATDQDHLQTMELYTTYPDPYNIGSGNWQHIHAQRKEAVWYLSLNDTITKELPTTKASDVYMWDRPAYLGGRPGYQENVFRGIIKDLIVNGYPVDFTGKKGTGNVYVGSCQSKRMKEFERNITNLVESESEYDYNYAGDAPMSYEEYLQWYQYQNSKDDKISKWNKKVSNKGKGRKNFRRNQHTIH